ncbi:MAG: hypothetical protein IAE94_11225 [Chthoniobacterales bacterium]|nr:hypothetical protein [Chthoniobacterales bacterium]
MRVLLITVGVLLALVAAALIGASLWIQSFVRSEAFRSLLADATGDAFEATASFEPLRWTGASVYAESAKLTGRNESALKEFQASQLRAEVNWRAAFSGAWRVEDLTISRLEGTWQFPSDKSAAQKKSSSATKSPAGILAFLPKRFELGALKIDAANLTFGNVRVRDSTITIRPDGSGWLFQGSGGKLLFPGQPELVILGFRAREQGGEYFLTEGKFRLGKNGKISASGEFADAPKIQLTWEEVSASDLLTGDWSQKLSGTLSGAASVTHPERATGTFHLQEGRLENIPLLSTVADFTGNPAFRKMALQGIRGDFTYEKGSLQIRNFSAESKGLLRLEGSATLGQRGELSGHFQIGVTAQSLQGLPGSRERVFTNPRDGYVWTDLTLGGTLKNPTENLSARLAVAAGSSLIEKGAGLIKDPQGNAVEGVKSVLDLLQPLLP